MVGGSDERSEIAAASGFSGLSRRSRNDYFLWVMRLGFRADARNHREYRRGFASTASRLGHLQFVAAVAGGVVAKVVAGRFFAVALGK